jgi:hypothetical protein
VASYCRLPTRLDISISRGEGSSRADTTSSYAYVPGPLRVFEDVIADCRRCQSRSFVKDRAQTIASGFSVLRPDSIGLVKHPTLGLRLSYVQ